MPTTGARGLLTAPGLLLGLGLGGFVDGILLHQVLQWHHMLTDYGEYRGFPAETSVAQLEDNVLWDGLFHTATWVFIAVGLALLWRAWAAGSAATKRSFVGLLLTGWGLFNLVEGVVDHHVLTLHHVRDDVAEPLWWDLGFLALGLLLVGIGGALVRSDRNADEQPESTPGRADARATHSPRWPAEPRR